MKPEARRKHESRDAAKVHRERMVSWITWFSLGCDANAGVLESKVIEVDGRWLTHKRPCMLLVENEKCTVKDHSPA